MAGGARKLGIALLGAVALYGAGLLVASKVAEGQMAARIQSRVAASLDAEVSLGGVEVSLLRGRATLTDLVIRRDRGGLLEIRCPSIEVRFRAGGGYLFDRRLDRVTIAEPTLSISALGAFALRRRAAEPLLIDDLQIVDGRITVIGSTILPNLAELTVDVRRARARRVVLKTGLSWIFGLEELSATAAVGGSLTVGVAYDGETIALAGSLFGSRPLELPFALPAPDPEALEPAQLRAVGTALAKKVGAAWFRREVSGRLRTWLE